MMNENMNIFQLLKRKKIDEHVLISEKEFIPGNKNSQGLHSINNITMQHMGFAHIECSPQAFLGTRAFQV